MDQMPTTHSSTAKPLLSLIDTALSREREAIDSLRREIAVYGARRCDVGGSRDNLVYRHGQLFEVQGQLDLDPVAVVGLLDERAPYMAWLTAAAMPGDALGFAERVRRVLADPQRSAWCRELGAWRQWQRLKAVYDEQITKFAADDAAMSSKERARWRSRSVTREQRFIIARICELTGDEQPAPRNRGEAAAYIAAAGGNPRFTQEPPAPPA